MKKDFLHHLFMGVAASALTFGLYACSNENDSKPNGGGDDDEDVYATEAFFISTTGDSDEYILLVENIDKDETIDQIDYVQHQSELSGYTWIFNSDPSAAIGLIYNQGDPGVGLGFGINEDGSLKAYPNFNITTRFTSYGFFENYALTSVGGQTLAGTTTDDGVLFNFIDLHNNLTMTSKTMSTLNISGNGEQASLSGIVDMGDGTFLSGLVLSQPRGENATGGSSTGTINYPDSVWVGVFDADLNLKKLYSDDRISYSSGRYRSQYYSQIGKADDGTVYVFSGSYEYNYPIPVTNPAGALRINKGADDFDPDYYFNIEELSGGYRFRKVWHITGNYFLLEVYNHIGGLTNIDDPATQYAVVDAKEKTFKWVKNNFPATDIITSTGQPMPYKGKMYLPVTAQGENPAIYIINPADASVTKGISIRGAKTMRAIGRLVD